MLKEILSQSRKSGSLSRQSDSSALSRQPSTERKSTSRIELHCNSGKKLEMDSKEQSVKDLKGDGKKEANKQTSLEQGIDQVQFKNLVKNRLNKDKEKNKENPKTPVELKPQAKLVELPKPIIHETRMLVERTSNGFNRMDTLKNSKLESAATSKMLESSLGYNQASLCKLVEESGIKQLLKIEHLNESALQRSHQ